MYIQINKKMSFYLFLKQSSPPKGGIHKHSIIDMLLISGYVTHFWICHSFLDNRYIGIYAHKWVHPGDTPSVRGCTVRGGVQGMAGVSGQCPGYILAVPTT